MNADESEEIAFSYKKGRINFRLKNRYSSTEAAESNLMSSNTIILYMLREDFSCKP